MAKHRGSHYSSVGRLPNHAASKPEQAINLDFGLASLEGYTPYAGPKLEVSALITSLEKANVDAAAITYRHQEEGRVAITERMERNQEEYVPYFVHPLSKLQELAGIHQMCQSATWSVRWHQAQSKKCY